VVRGGTLRAVARQAIPRFDLYAALGVEPSADLVAIEAAYLALVEREDPDSSAAANRRIVRARIARDWLTDPDLRTTYNASRARAAARSAGKGSSPANATGAADAATTSDAAPDQIEDGVERAPVEAIPWPAADFDRAERAASAAALGRDAADPDPRESTIHWSAIPPEAPDAPAAPAAAVRASRRSTRTRRMPVGALGWGALIVAGAVAAYLLFTAFGSSNTASRETATPPIPTPTLLVTASPQPSIAAPSVAPTTAPPPSANPPDIDTVAMRQAAWDTLQSLIAAAEAGDVETAQTMLGDTAPGLRASGLRRAAFPGVTALQLNVQPDATGYVAIADETSRLTSPDGKTWTFDYGDRPLATYRTSSTDTHDLWWEESDGQHHLHVRIAYATLSKQTVAVRVAWSFDADRPDDATYFERSELILSGLTFDGAPDILLAGPRIPMAGTTTVTTSAMYAAGTLPAVLPKRISIGITITNPRTVGGADRAIDTTFLLAIR
jgi:hypothetical protein